MMQSYNDLYLDVRKVLKREGIEAASLEARELICAASGKTKEDFLRDLPLYVPDFVQKKLDDFLVRHLQGEPVAYLVGEWEFYGLPLTINRHVLIPRPDTELLVDRAIIHAEKAGEGARVLDLCAGSGAIGLAIASQVKSCRTILVELSIHAQLVCKQNIRRNQLSSRVACLPGNALEAPPRKLWDFDLIACNPPYIPTADLQDLDVSVRDFEPHLALDGGVDGLDFYRSVSALWSRSLRPGGWLLFEVGIHQAESVRKLMEQAGFIELQILPDLAGIPRVVEGRIPLPVPTLREAPVDLDTQEPTDIPTQQATAPADLIDESPT